MGWVVAGAREIPTGYDRGVVMGITAHANDAMIARLSRELEERNAFVQGIIARAQDAERDLNDSEREQLADARNRISELKTQLSDLESTAEIAQEVATRAARLDAALTRAREGFSGSGRGSSEVEYRSAGEYLLDLWAAQTGDRKANDRLEIFNRVAAHQKTGDNPGVIPDPIVGPVINFIDAARPIVSFLGPQAMPSASWHRPKVTQHSAVGVQGSAGAAADEKAELVSQKMTITRLPASAVTYGGYVNVSRQNVDFSSPSALDLVVNDLAAQYAIETEAATAAELATTGTTAVNYTAGDQNSLATAIWSAAATAYNAVKGQGRLALAIAPDRLASFGPLFSPVNPQSEQGSGFSAGQFGQGVMGNISGIPVVMSAGLGTGEAFLLSSAAVEAFEQRVGTLQAVEPSVLGVQVAYAGYFTPLKIEDGGIVPLVEGA